jgi:pimeloyl-ACP methyl ester carboxylesterase
MIVSTKLRALFAALAMTTASVASAAQAQNPVRRTEKVILVHGAWADGSSWSKIIPLLEAKGLEVKAVQLPLTSLADDVATLQRALELEDKPVLLVGHSYGGAVITQAGDDPKVAGLVYVSAYAPKEGESALDEALANPTPVGPYVVPDLNGFVTLPAEAIERDFAQDLKEKEQKVLTAAQGPTSVAALSGPMTSVAWRVKPSWFVVAANDRIISPDLERLEAARMNAVTITVPTSHVAMLAEPTIVATFIEIAARQVFKHGR